MEVGGVEEEEAILARQALAGLDPLGEGEVLQGDARGGFDGRAPERKIQARHGTGVLFITHDFGVVAEIAHRVAVGRVAGINQVRQQARAFDVA